jgi:hypothetical protein
MDFLKRWEKTNPFSSMIGYEQLNPTKEGLFVLGVCTMIDTTKT